MPSVTRKPRPTRAERHAERRAELAAQLLGAVERLMAGGSSFTEISVERLIREAGVTRSTFYVYFEDKGDLLAAGAERMIGDIVSAAARWWSLGPGTTRADVRDAMGAIHDAFVPHGTTMAAVIESAPYDARVREQFQALTDGAIGEVAAHIAAGEQAGFVRPGLRPERTATWLSWMIERGMGTFVATSAPGDVEVELDALAGIVWNTLYAGVS